MTSKATMNFVLFLVCKNLKKKVPTCITCNSATIVGHVSARYPQRVNQQGIIYIVLPDHQLIFSKEKFLGLKEAHVNILNSVHSTITRLTFLRNL